MKRHATFREVAITIIALLFLAALVIGKVIIGDPPMTDITLAWDRYDTSIPQNSAVTHLRLCQLIGSTTLQTVQDSIAVTDTLLTFQWPADGREYHFTLLAVSPHAESDMSNVVAVRMPNWCVPFPPAGLKIGNIGQ